MGEPPGVAPGRLSGWERARRVRSAGLLVEPRRQVQVRHRDAPLHQPRDREAEWAANERQDIRAPQEQVTAVGGIGLLGAQLLYFALDVVDLAHRVSPCVWSSPRRAAL